MRTALAALVLILASAAPVAAQPPQPGDATTICLRPDGRTTPADCRQIRAGESNAPCFCSYGQPVRTPYCIGKERSAPESRGLQLARRDLARDGTLEGDTYRGKPLCVRYDRRKSAR
jgi:hypothetical protein